MSTVVEKQRDAAKYESQVDRQLAEATSRIRFHDLAVGGLLLGGMVLAYAAAMILLDKYLVLPQAVRQGALAAFAAAVAGVGYFAVVRPLARRVNPLYAAVQVEKTIDNAQNSVASYVDLKERDMPPAIRTAIAGRAAKSVGQADLNRAVDHRGLVYLGVAAAVLALALVVLFFVFRPPQFLSLAKRAFAPFAAGDIVTRTQLTLLRPADGDTTVTEGQPVAVGVYIKGRVPSADADDRPRLLLRHNPADQNYDEIPLEKGEDPREWGVRVPDHMVRYGFWYKVAAGDAETPEYRVNVRSKPLLEPDSIEVLYDYPAYLRTRPEVARGDPAAKIEAHRGTHVTFAAKTNRQVKEGRLEVTFEDRSKLPLAVLADPVPGKPDHLSFRFALTESGGYAVTFADPNGERSEPFTNRVQVIADQPPQVVITKPEAEEIELPANGQLAVDGAIGDDQGVATAALRFRLRTDAGNGKKFVELAAKPFQGGKSFRRDADGTFPTAIEYKDSVELAKLTDPNGKPVELKEAQVLEYWLEATDNCTEPAPNVGRSRVQRVKLLPPVKEPEQQQKQDQDRQQRRNEEQQNNQQQQQRLEQEKREPKKGQHEPRPDAPQQPPEPKEGDPKKDADPNAAPKDGQGGGEKKPADPKSKTADNPPPNKDNVPPEKGAENPPPMPMPKAGDPENKTPQDNPMPGGQGKGDPAAKKNPPETGGENTGPGGGADKGAPKDQDLQKQADQIQKELDREKTSGGEPKPNNTPDPNAPPPQAESKPKPDGDSGSAAESKATPPQGSPNDPKGGNPEGTSKPEGNLEPPPPPSQPKPDAGQPKPQNPGGGSEKEEPLGGSGGQERPTPPDTKTPDPKTGAEPKDGKGQQSPGDAKPAGNENRPPSGGTEPKEGTDPQPKGGPQDPTGGAAKSKPMPEPGRGTSREPDAKRDPQQQPDKPDAGSAKPERSPDAGADQATPKPAPQPDAGGEKGSEQKPAPQPDPNGGKPGEARPDSARKDDGKATGGKPEPGKQPSPTDLKGGKKEQVGGNVGDKTEPMPERGTERPTPQAGGQKPDAKDARAPQQPGQAPGPKEKLDPKEIADAAKDLNNPDPKKQQDAREKLDKMVGKDAREQAEQMAKDLQSPDKEKREAAEKKLREALDRAKEEAEKNRQAGNDPNPMPKDGQDPTAAPGTPKDDPKGKPGDPKAGKEPGASAGGKKEATKAGKDPSASKDEPKGAPGEPKPGKDGDANAADPKKGKDGSAGAKSGKDEPGAKDGPKAENPTPKGGDSTAQKKDAPGKKMTPGEMEKLAKKAEDLNSPDDAKREAAEKELDRAMGKKNREELQQTMKDLKSDDKKTREAAQEKVKEMAKKAQDEAEKQAKENGPPGKDGKPDPKGQPLSKEEQEQLARKLQDLASPDDDTRKKAEKEFDDKLGKENRDALQKKVQDAAKQPGKEPQPADDAKKQLDELAKNPPTGKGRDDADLKSGGGNVNAPLNKPMDDDPRNRLKSAELQLEQFKRNEHNKDLQDRLKMTPDEYGRFVKGYEEMVNRMRADAEQAEKAGPKGVAPPPGFRVGDGGRVEAKSTNATGGAAGVGGPAFAPPGYQDAQKKFAEEAGRRSKK